MPLTFKQTLERIMEERPLGPSPTFSLYQLLRALELIAAETTGRGKLALQLRLGEGAVRTMISRLRNAGLISTSRKGCSLTEEGRRLWNEHQKVFQKKLRIKKDKLAMAEHNLAFLVKNRAHRVESGMRQRDAAIMVGAKGATTIMFKDERLIIPSVSNNVAGDFPKAADQIIRALRPEENDVIIIGSANDMVTAEYGALAAAWTLINDNG